MGLCCGGCDVQEPAGSGFSTELALQWGYSLTTGGRAYMEDYHTAEQRETAQGEPVGCFGIYDGHGGRTCVRFLRAKLVTAILSQSSFARSDVPTALTEAFMEVDRHFLDKAGTKKTCGSTATVAIVQRTRIHIAHVGDSRAVLVTQNGPLVLTRDHKPSDTSEAQRIQDLGGTITCDDIARVEGVLAVTRAFGNNTMKRIITAEPELYEHVLNSNDEFLVIASDGVWDMVSNDRAAQIVRRAPDLLAAAEGLTTEAYRLGSMDNISAVVVRLNYRGPLSLSQRASTAVRTLSQRGVRPQRPPGPPANALTLALTPEDREYYAQQAAAAPNGSTKPRQPSVRFADDEHHDAAPTAYVSSDIAATAGTSAHMNARTLPVTDSGAVNSGASSDIGGSSGPVWSGTLAPGRPQQAAPPLDQDGAAGGHMKAAPNGAHSVPQYAHGAEHLARMSPVIEEAASHHSGIPNAGQASAHASADIAQCAPHGVTAPVQPQQPLQRQHRSLPAGQSNQEQVDASSLRDRRASAEHSTTAPLPAQHARARFA